MAYPKTQFWLSTFRQPDIRAVDRLALHIGELSLRNAEKLKGCIHADDEKQRRDRSFLVLCEFLYLFVHLANRFSFGLLGHEKRCKVQEEIYPIIARPMIETIFGHWPPDLKEGMENDLRDKLNDSEIEYGQCKQLFDPKRPFSEDTVLSKFATNVCELLGVTKSDCLEYMKTFKTVMEVCFASLRELKFPETVRAIGKEL